MARCDADRGERNSAEQEVASLEARIEFGTRGRCRKCDRRHIGAEDKHHPQKRLQRKSEPKYRNEKEVDRQEEYDRLYPDTADRADRYAGQETGRTDEAGDERTVEPEANLRHDVRP